MYYFFSVKQNVKDIFIEGHRRKEQRQTNMFLSLAWA